MGDYAGPISSNGNGNGGPSLTSASGQLTQSSSYGNPYSANSTGSIGQPTYPSNNYSNQGGGYQQNASNSSNNTQQNISGMSTGFAGIGASDNRDQPSYPQMSSSNAYNNGSTGYPGSGAYTMNDSYQRQTQQQGSTQTSFDKMSFAQNQAQYYHDSNAQQQQQHRKASDANFGTPSAGPPSPGKMDMLPHGTGPNHPTFSSTQKNKGRAVETYEPVTSHHARTTSKGSSTTSEFTKRKNWSQRIVEEMQDVLHVLSPSGIFLFASPSIFDLTGYTAEELVGRGITDFIEKDDIDGFLRDFSASIHNDTALTTYFRFRRKDEKTILFEVTGQPYCTVTHSPGPSPSANADSAANGMQLDDKKGETTRVCKSFFAMARLYPSKNNAMLDSFLELKIENEKLRQKLSTIYKEIEGDGDALQSSLGYNEMQSNSGANAAFGSANNDARPISGFPQRTSLAQQGNYDASALQQTNTQQQEQAMQQGQNNQSYAYPGGQQDTRTDYGNQQQGQGQHMQLQQQQTNQYDQQQQRGTAIDQNNVLVSSSGLIPSTSNTYGALGIGISSHARQQQQQQQQQQNSNSNNNQSNGLSSASNNATSTQPSQANPSGGAGDSYMEGGAGSLDDKNKKKMKKQRVEEGEFVCRDCGTVDSPEWRRGPLGPKTLCNACGLRWAKKNKQANRQSIGGAGEILN